MGSYVEEVGLNKVCLPLTDHRTLLPLSYSDIRRIAAVKAKERLQQKMKLQDKLIPWGKYKLNSTPASSLLPKLSDSHIKTILSTWDYFVKHIDSQGVKLFLHYLSEHPEHAQHYRKLPVIRGPGSLASFRRHPDVIRYGRSLILHITEIIVNLRNNATLENMIDHKFELLRKAGYTTEHVTQARDSLLTFLRESLPSQWSVDVEAAWKNMTDRVLELGQEFWASPGGIKAKCWMTFKGRKLYPGIAKKARFSSF